MTRRGRIDCSICGHVRWVYDTTPEQEFPTCVPCQAITRFFQNPAGEWVRDALCAQVDAELFYPPPNSAAVDAKRVCSQCPVRDLCLAYALENEERWGVWGGMTAGERKRLLKKGSAA